MAERKFLGEEGLAALIARCKTLSWEVRVVDSLPETGEDRILYLVKDSGATGSNVFDEYIWAEGAWEMLGSATLEIDLSDYAKKSDFDGLKDYVEELKSAVEEMEASEVTDVTASGSGELTLSAAKSGTVVAITGSVDLSEYQKSADLVEITAQDVDEMWEA